MLIAGSISIASYAQPATTPVQDKPKLSKEEKAKVKAKQEEEQTALLTEAGLDADQQKKVAETLAQAKDKAGVIKKNDAIAADDKTAQLKVINEEKNAKLKEIMGEEKWKHYNELKKKQKAATTTM